LNYGAMRGPHSSVKGATEPLAFIDGPNVTISLELSSSYSHYYISNKLTTPGIRAALGGMA